MWHPSKKQVLAVAGAALLIAPLFAYVAKFGTRLSNNHQTWGEFGSFLGGIYAPVFALATIALLFRQNQIQERQSTLESLRNISNRAKADLEYHVAELRAALDKPVTGFTDGREYLSQMYAMRSLDELLSESWLMYAQSAREFSPALVDHWHAINLAYFALGYDESPDLARLQAAQRLIATLGRDECHALDNLLIALWRKDLAYKLIFTKYRDEL